MSVDAQAVLAQIAQRLQDARLKWGGDLWTASEYVSEVVACEEIARAAAVDMAIEKVHGDQTQENT